jgi:hypothetical protein
VIKVILDAFPEAIHHHANDGQLPLHYACRASSSNKNNGLSHQKVSQSVDSV